jgi:hypothetical protein
MHNLEAGSVPKINKDEFAGPNLDNSLSQIIEENTPPHTKIDFRK